MSQYRLGESVFKRKEVEEKEPYLLPKQPTEFELSAVKCFFLCCEFLLAAGQGGSLRPAPLQFTIAFASPSRSKPHVHRESVDGIRF